MMTPYRLIVFGTTTTPAKGRRPATVQRWAIMGWTADQTAEGHRLPGSGTFLYHGGIRACMAARAYLAAGADAVSVRTNQDRPVLYYTKDPAGRVTVRAAEGFDHGC